MFPDLEHHESDNSGWCAYMHRHDDIGYWKVVKCSDAMSYICEIPRKGYTEPPTTTTTPKPEAKCPGEEWEWIKYNDHCYKVINEFHTASGVGYGFDDARAFCQTSFGGDLVSFGDSDEETQVGIPVPYGYYWIGYRQDNKVEYFYQYLIYRCFF